MTARRPTRLSNRMRFVVKASGGDPKVVTLAEYEQTYKSKEKEVSAKYPDGDFSAFHGGQPTTADTKSENTPRDSLAHSATTGQGQTPIK